MRPQFKRRAAFKQSPVTGMFEFVQSVTMYYVRMLFSYTVIGTLVGIVLVSVFSILLLRVTLQRKLENDWGTYITSVISAVQIAVMSFVYKLLARKLTEFGMFSRTSLSPSPLSLPSRVVWCTVVWAVSCVSPVLCGCAVSTLSVYCGCAMEARSPSASCSFVPLH